MPRPLTFDEMAEELHAGEDPGDIILFPPDDGVVTDDDSRNVNEANVLQLPSRILLYQAELQTRPSVSPESSQENEAEEVERPVPKNRKKENTIK
ncbi:hypothetical protein HHI36_013009 [Cryptolaemus montrouzieri]|uniref:Uncharacterized protein n=1 Tax=Cryptolaemus montrouzieri TaxID=559131 RepID=A0ABD2NFX7_9CUCU